LKVQEMSTAAVLAKAESGDDLRPRAGRPILVIDDQAQVRQLIARMLEGAGHDVVQAANGEEALSLLDLDLDPRLIVLDLWMPIVDGWEFMERARTRSPIILITGVEEEAYPLPECVVRFLKKPIARDQLLDAVRAADGRAGEARRG
jgi:CheY-like chemotaxis protein